MRLADYIIDYFYSKGVTTLFSVTGRGSLFLNDAVARHKNIKCIFNHHEQASAFAAVGYSQAKNDVGVCLVSTGDVHILIQLQEYYLLGRIIFL